MPQERGVYFLANDNIWELAIAFLNSFRSYNPIIPLCLIPFDDDFQRLAVLQSRYEFSIWSDLEILRQCDNISLSFHDQPLGQYRKLATWEGVYDKFLYIDTDAVVLRNIDFIFDYLDDFGFLVATSNMSGRVWKKSIYETGKLTSHQIDFSANTGFIASKKRCLKLDDVAGRLPSAIELAIHHMELEYEQPFLNYLIVTSGMPYTSLREIMKNTGNPNIPGELYANPNTPGRLFAQMSDVVVKDGQIVYPSSPPTLLVHWVGPLKPTLREKRSIPLYELWEFYRYMPISPHRK